MPIELARSTAAELLALPRDRTVFFFAVGPLEEHGPHLPAGSSLLVARELCRLTAERVERELPGWRAVLMPDAPLGVESDTVAFRITVRAHVLRDWLVDACASLMRSGFNHFVCYSGHLGPRQLTAIEEAGKIVQRRGRWKALRSGLLAGKLRGRLAAGLVSARSALVPMADVLRSPLLPDPPEHAGKEATSHLLAIDAAQVRAGFEGLSPIERARGFWARYRERRTGGVPSYWGKPSEARAEDGRASLEQVVRDVFPKLRAVWEGSNPNFIFRSWYSVIPPNRSFFLAWVLAFFCLVLMTAWVYLNLKALNG